MSRTAVKEMRQIVHQAGVVSGTVRVVLALMLVCVVGPIDASVARAASLSDRLAPTTVTATQPSDRPPVPLQARQYALDAAYLGTLPYLSGGLTEQKLVESADGSTYKNQFQTSASGPAAITVESTVYILSAEGHANQTFNELRRAKQGETGRPPSSERGIEADRALTYETPNESGDRMAGGVVLYRNAVGLVEIRGQGSHVGIENVKVLMSRVLQGFQRAAQTSGAASAAP
jgi:hypothetical protein